MKILFLHLSDSHLKDSTNLREINTDALVSSIKQMGNFDECILVFSGDVVNSGNVNEYKVAAKLMGSIIKGIKDKYLIDKQIQTLIVPGNHDNLAKNPKRNGEEIKSYFVDKKTDEHFNNDLEELTNFFEFANRNRCYRNRNAIEIKKLNYENLLIKVNLINSAPFSILGSDNGDKGRHYLPENELKKLDWDYNENFTISIIHHGPEWFADSVKKALYNKMYFSSDLILVGHEHFSQNENSKVNGKKYVNISTGIALYGTKTEHGFNAIILDTSNRNLVGYQFIYNGKIYKPSITPILESEVIFRGNNKFTFTRKFRHFLESDIGQREGQRYLEYFVFPPLEAKNINTEMKNLRINSEEKFFEIFNSKRKISIEGSTRIGKTLLAKYLCLKLSENYVPLLLTEEDFSLKSSKKIVKNCLESMYGEDSDYDEYMQLSKDKKVLIVDRYDNIKKEKWKDFLSDVENEYSHIILFCGTDFGIDIKEKALEELTSDNMFYLKLCPFYYAKRKELITKICECQNDKEIIEIDEKITKINEEINNQIKFFQLTPDFIHQYVDYYLHFLYTDIQTDSNIFNKVFEANIIYRIQQNTNAENIPEILIALDFVAKNIHFNKKYPLPIEEFRKSVEDYNAKYDNELNPDEVFSIASKSNIIKGIMKVEFCDKNLLAYFTAMHLNRAYNDGECIEELKYVLNNICFGINGDILLFLSYITSNIRILNPIMESIINHMQSWEEFNLDTKNISYLYDMAAPVRTNLPTEKDKQKLLEEKTEIERNLVEEKQITAESLYSYDEEIANSFGYKIIKSLSYLELVAKILPNFRHILTGDQKRVIVKVLYEYPNKLLYFMLKDLDEHQDIIIEEILNDKPKTRKGLLITKNMLKKSIQNQSVSFILSIYDLIASTSVNSKTIKDLNKFEYDNNTNYDLMNIMMEENLGEFSRFSYKAEKLYKKAQYNITKQMISLIVRKYYISHEVKLAGKAQQLADLFFAKGEKKTLQIIQAKNRLQK